LDLRVYLAACGAVTKFSEILLKMILNKTN